MKFTNYILTQKSYFLNFIAHLKHQSSNNIFVIGESGLTNQQKDKMQPTEIVHIVRKSIKSFII